MLTLEAQRWAATRPTPTLLVPIDPVHGLRRHHVDLLIDWVNPGGEEASAPTER